MGPQGVSTNQQYLRCWQWDLYPFHALKKDFHCDWLSLQKHVDRLMTDVRRERLFWREPESWSFLLDEQCRITLGDGCSDSCEKVRETLRNLMRDRRVWRVQKSKLKCSIRRERRLILNPTRWNPTAWTQTASSTYWSFDSYYEWQWD